MLKPIIGINADFANATGDRPSFTYVASGYYDAIGKVGGIPLIIPPLDNDEDIEQLLDRLNGVVLVGGADLDPRRDGWMLHPTIRPLAPRRELFDRRLDADHRPAQNAGVRHRRGDATAQRIAGRQSAAAHPRRSARRRCRTTIRSIRPIGIRWRSCPAR